MKRVLLSIVVACVTAACPFTCDSIRGYCAETGNCHCTGNECCAAVGQPCESEVDCCGNGQCEFPPQGGPRVCTGATRRDGGQCSTAALPCSTNDACCSGSCVGNRCACRQPGDPCEFDSDCCNLSECNDFRCGVREPDGGFRR